MKEKKLGWFEINNGNTVYQWAFRALRRRFYPKVLTISTLVRRKRYDNISLLAQ